MDYKKLSEINDRLKNCSTPFQRGGKIYVEVSKRIQGFWELYPNGRIITDFTELTETHAVCRAIVYDGEIMLATGTAREDKGAGFVNKTSYVENAETSAVGRALGILGIGSVDAIASADEVRGGTVGVVEASPVVMVNGDPVPPATPKRQSKAKAKEEKLTVRRQFVSICKSYGLNVTDMSKSFHLSNDSTDDEFAAAIDGVKKMMEGA